MNNLLIYFRLWTDSASERSFDRSFDAERDVGGEFGNNGMSSSTDNYHSSEQEPLTQSDTSPRVRRAVRGVRAGGRRESVDKLMAESCRRLTAVAKSERNDRFV